MFKTHRKLTYIWVACTIANPEALWIPTVVAYCTVRYGTVVQESVSTVLNSDVHGSCDSPVFTVVADYNKKQFKGMHPDSSQAKLKTAQKILDAYIKDIFTKSTVHATMYCRQS